MNVVIIRYNAGNIHSVRIALQRVGLQPLVSDDISLIKKADKIIFPGVGEASSAMSYLKEKGITDLLPGLKQPVLGICLGLQLMCSYSEENNTKCLGIFPVVVKKFPPYDKIPHIGWNNIFELRGKLFDNIAKHNQADPDVYVYFVHSYYAELDQLTVAKSEYIIPFSAALQKNNFYAVQFHPEKSGDVGERILKNFLEL
jgi:glutamine amidotransferase